jgi:putative tryptophan/tyrosine transport system substrate-binding protein
MLPLASWAPRPQRLHRWRLSPFSGARRGADYVSKIVKGAKPSELPVEQPMGYALHINLKIAKALELEVPPTLLARADEVIE